jgi:DNA-binding XRE family transcriptional regulator
METTGQRLKRLRTAKGLSQAKLAKEAGLSSQGAIGNIEADTRGYGESIVDIARVLGTTPDYLRMHSDDQHQVITSHEDDDTQGVKINPFDTGGAMGHGVVLRDQPGVIKSWTVSDSWLQQNVHRITAAKNLCIVTGFGPSMQPLFNPGDPLLVDRGITRVDVDAVYFFRIGTEGFIKQVQRLYVEDRLVLRAKSYNTMYDPFDIPQNGDFEVFGRVVKLWRGEEF